MWFCVRRSFTSGPRWLDDKFLYFISTNRVFMKTLSEAAHNSQLHCFVSFQEEVIFVPTNFRLTTHTHSERGERERRHEQIQKIYKLSLTRNHLYVLCVCVCVCMFVCAPFFGYCCRCCLVFCSYSVHEFNPLLCQTLHFCTQQNNLS